MKNSNYIIGNRTRDLPACSVVPQPTAPPRAPSLAYIYDFQYKQLFTGESTQNIHILCQPRTFRTADGAVAYLYLSITVVQSLEWL
jgi:hypothetical protein